MEKTTSKIDLYKENLYAELARNTGVEKEKVKKILETMGIDKDFLKATKLLGQPPKSEHLRLGYKFDDGVDPC